MSFWTQCISLFHCLIVMRFHGDNSLSLTVVDCLGMLLNTFASAGLPVKSRFSPLMMSLRTGDFGMSSTLLGEDEVQTLPPLGNNLLVVKGL